MMNMKSRIGRAAQKAYQWILNALEHSWQFIIGGVLTLGLTVAIFYHFGIRLQFPSTGEPSKTAVSQASRTVVDTTRPWTYDFANVPSGELDRKIWNVENSRTKADYNDEAQTFTNRTDNVRVENGVLVLEAKSESRDGQRYTSGRIDTEGSFAFNYGTLEIEAKIPRGVGTWPAAWMMPSNPRYKAEDFPSANNQEHIWSLNGELDFLESVGYLPGQNIPASHSYNSRGREALLTPGFISNPYDEFHRYGIIKKAESIEFTIDGQVYARRDKTSTDPLEWPFDQPYYLILNLSLGGEWADRYGIDDASGPWRYEIKTIKYTPL